MNYKEALLFIAKCLTITHEAHNKSIVEATLKLTEVDWDAIVKVSTGHFVFPALYSNLKRADFLHFLPTDLVEYMKHITDLNRERNQQIIKQAKEVNELLLANNITPIFLKGTGNLLEGLYEDIAERMVGDIDILIDKKQCNTAYSILKKNGYLNKTVDLLGDHRHLPRLTHPKKIAAIEIHKEMLRDKKASFFNYNSVKSDFLKTNGAFFLSYKNQIKLTVFAKFINDRAYQLKSISLRAAYDLFLQANKLEFTTHITDKKISKELNAGINLYTVILAQPPNLSFNETKHSLNFVKTVIKKLENSVASKSYTKLTKAIIWLQTKITVILKATYKKSYFKFLLYKIKTQSWRNK